VAFRDSLARAATPDIPEAASPDTADIQALVSVDIPELASQDSLVTAQREQAVILGSAAGAGQVAEIAAIQGIADQVYPDIPDTVLFPGSAVIPVQGFPAIQGSVAPESRGIQVTVHSAASLGFPEAV
jgi:hypothetical protein